MSKFYLDAGTTWSKILEITDDNEKKYSVIKSSSLKDFQNIIFEKTTGHNFNHVQKKEHVNEVVALVKGCEHLIKPDGIVLDLGSRDIKWAKYKNDNFSDMDWNSSCASATGATIEMLLKFYNLNVSDLEFTKDRYSVTCGIFGLEQIMDDISNGLSAKVAISKFVHGIAFNAYNFTKTPEKIFISGGFCENKCFLDSLSYYTEVVSIGRFVLVDGLSRLPLC
ncbi:MAG: ATPase [Cyanobacteria bacterium SIG30]|nr:ATPase [Cyanobacteria bacterium SIG30]